MTTILICDGTRVGRVAVPEFAISIGEYIGIADPTTSSAERFDLMQVLGGVRRTAEIRITGTSSVVAPPGCERSLHAKASPTITDIAISKGIPKALAERAIAHLGLSPELPYANLQLTSRLRLELKLAWAQREQLVVFSTCGLDPSGVAAVAKDVLNMLQDSSAIHVFSEALIDFYQSIDVFSRVLRCKFYEMRSERGKGHPGCRD